MKILLNTNRRLEMKPEKFSEILDSFDLTFSKRYLKDGFVWQGITSKEVTPEDHYEADKYHIFYIDTDDIDLCLNALKQLPCVLLIGEVDKKYTLKVPVLYVADVLSQNKNFQRNEEFVIPNNLCQRPSNFIPRPPEPF